MSAHESCWTVNHSTGRIYRRTEPSGEVYYEGIVMTPHGIVSAYSQGQSGKYAKNTRLDFIHSGKCYSRSFKKAMSPRGIAIVAGRFAAEMAGAA